ncbi:hypothetical protein [Streptomyces sp. A012304]|uniref:hypothetical protein n=1 Tax=Streptomyces sp. A012304 TaxID=375446 RepID=UPI0022308F86|nr:hypothetical protein [Streptomyces sp. A012304]GKQ37870.1 hypothetical protein ALMP_44060 [Streptomyces sp. A012304]
MSRIVRAIGAAVAGLALVGAVQGPAQAAGTTAEAVPSCVEGREYFMITVFLEITNKCTTTQQVKVEYNRQGQHYIADKCYTLEPGQKVTATMPWWAGERFVQFHPC